MDEWSDRSIEEFDPFPLAVATRAVNTKKNPLISERILN
jgi:hypothetical protein